MRVHCHGDWLSRLYERFAERPAPGGNQDQDQDSSRCLRFTDLCRDSACIIVDVIDFGLSSSLVFSVWKSLSDRLHRGLSLELPSRRMAFTVAYHQPGHSIALGRLWLDRGNLEALYARHWAQRWTAQATASIARPPPLSTSFGTVSSTLNSGPAQLRLQVEHASSRQSLVYSYVSLGRTVGLQFCRRLTRDPVLWTGTEVYYAIGEASGGLAVGVKWNALRDPVRAAPLTGTLLFNPILGHVQLACTSPIIMPGLMGSLRYDVNLHSFDADLAAGLVYSTHHQSGRWSGASLDSADHVPATSADEGKQIDANGQTMVERAAPTASFLKLRASWRHGLALSVLSELMEGNVSVEMSISTGPLCPPTGSNANISIPRPAFPTNPCIGLTFSLGS